MSKHFNACMLCKVERPCDRANCKAWQIHEEEKQKKYARNKERNEYFNLVETAREYNKNAGKWREV